MRRPLALLALALAACHESSTHQPAHPPARQQVDRAKAMAITSDDRVTVLAPLGATAEGAVAISPADHRIAIAAGIREPATGTFFVDVFRSNDGGVTWTAPKPLPLTTTSGRALIGHYDPALAFDRTGTAYLVVMGKLGEILATVVLFKSTDNGA
ncbi:MAG TPA: sialidase family protein, partial [Thermoanaerobaculia bacterium]